MIHAEAPCYQGQRHPCYGSHPRALGADTVFSPWVHDGRVVHWGHPLSTRSEAVAEARRMAEVIEPQP
jgi:hypothetical protein